MKHADFLEHWRIPGRAARPDSSRSMPLPELPAIGLPGGTCRRQAAISQHRLGARFFPPPCLIEFLEVLGVSPGQHHVAEAVAVRPVQLAIFFKPLVGVVRQHLRPQIGIVPGSVSAAPNMGEIAGAVARRIVNVLEPGSLVKTGDKIGMIKFGSRVDLLLPVDSKINVNLNDIVTAGETVIGFLP